MYTSTMTADELVDEFTADLPQVISVSDAKQVKADKIIKKSKMFPVYLHAYVKTKRKNDWMILLEAKSNKYLGDDCLITLVSHFDVGAGRYAMFWTSYQGKPIHIMFTPHFFSRFAERMGVNLTGVELIHRYFKKNHSYGFNYTSDFFGNMQKINVYGSTTEGVAMGVQLNTKHNIILFRTFITYDMCKGQQIEDLARANEMRKEIHEELTTVNF